MKKQNRNLLQAMISDGFKIQIVSCNCGLTFVFPIVSSKVDFYNKKGIRICDLRKNLKMCYLCNDWETNSPDRVAQESKCYDSQDKSSIKFILTIEGKDGEAKLEYKKRYVRNSDIQKVHQKVVAELEKGWIP